MSDSLAATDPGENGETSLVLAGPPEPVLRDNMQLSGLSDRQKAIMLNQTPTGFMSMMNRITALLSDPCPWPDLVTDRKDTHCHQDEAPHGWIILKAMTGETFRDRIVLLLAEEYPSLFASSSFYNLSSGLTHDTCSNCTDLSWHIRRGSLNELIDKCGENLENNTGPEDGVTENPGRQLPSPLPATQEPDEDVPSQVQEQSGGSPDEDSPPHASSPRLPSPLISSRTPSPREPPQTPPSPVRSIEIAPPLSSHFRFRTPLLLRALHEGGNPPARERTLKIRNLASVTTNWDLENKLFRGYHIRSIVPSSRTGPSNRQHEVFVELETLAEAERAVRSLNGKEIDNHSLEIEMSHKPACASSPLPIRSERPREESQGMSGRIAKKGKATENPRSAGVALQAAPRARQPDQEPATRTETIDSGSVAIVESRPLHLSNLQLGTTRQHLREFFHNYRIDDDAIDIHVNKSYTRKYAFVKLADPSKAPDAIRELDGRNLRTCKVIMQIARTGWRQTQIATPGIGDKHLIVKNLPESVFESDLRRFFASYTHQIEHMHVHSRYAFFDISSEPEARRIVDEMDGTMFYGCVIRIEFCRPR